MSVVERSMCLVNSDEIWRVCSKMVVNTAFTSCDFLVPRKSVKKKYSLEALSISV
jgi:hypothetical protein